VTKRPAPVDLYCDHPLNARCAVCEEEAQYQLSILKSFGPPVEGRDFEVMPATRVTAREGSDDLRILRA
jgi:hypothetical protein